MDVGLLACSLPFGDFGVVPGCDRPVFKTGWLHSPHQLLRSRELKVISPVVKFLRPWVTNGSTSPNAMTPCMVPHGTAALLTAGGRPPSLVKIIAYMREYQLRWVSWDRHTHASPLAAGHCVPQGCALAVWMAAGAVAAIVPSEPVLTKVYIYGWPHFGFIRPSIFG